MAIPVKIKCSDCGTVADKLLRAEDAEIVCPECQRNMSSLPKDEYKRIASSLATQNIMGIIALVLAVAAAVLLYFYVGAPATWISTGDKEYVKKLSAMGMSRDTDTSAFLFGAIGCVVGSAIFGVLSSLKRYVVEF